MYFFPLYVGSIVVVGILSKLRNPNDPWLIIYPSIQQIAVRFWFIAVDKHIPLSSRLKMFMFYFPKLVNLSIWQLSWLLDDLLFPSHHVDLSNSVFIIGGFRTGTTTLHRYFQQDDRFCWLQLYEMVFPSLSYLIGVHKPIRNLLSPFFDLEKMMDKVLTPRILSEITQKRHYMQLFGIPEEDDLFIANWAFASWYTGALCPIEEIIKRSGDISAMRDSEQNRIVCMWERMIQKMVYFRRVDGRAKENSIYISKSHLVSLVPLWRKRYSNAKFITLLRDPARVFLSWRGLQDAGTSVIAGHVLPDSVSNPLNMYEWKKIYGNTMKFLKDHDDTFTVLFMQFVENPEVMLEKLYDFLQLQYNPEMFAYSFTKHKKHKAASTQSLKDIGYSADEVYSQLQNFCSWLDELGWRKPLQALPGDSQLPRQVTDYYRN